MTPSTGERNATATTRSTRYNNGYQRWYDGPDPGVNGSLTGSNHLLAEIRFNATAFPSPVNGVLTANAMTGGTAAASGTPTFARNLQSDGSTVNSHMSIGVAGSGPGGSDPDVVVTPVPGRVGAALVAGDVVNAPSSCTITEGIGS